MSVSEGRRVAGLRLLQRERVIWKVVNENIIKNKMTKEKILGV